ncbi:hypothetical protein OXX69_011704 [Metschnikowia pulcherrima]
MASSDHRRSEYSKNGCRECKRRKIKCDEFVDPPPEAYSKINHQGRESCWQCTRLKKVCEYPSKGERVARISRKILLERMKGSQDHDTYASQSASASPIDPRGVASIHIEPQTSEYRTMHPQPLGPPPAPPQMISQFNHASYPVPTLASGQRPHDERIMQSGVALPLPTDPNVHPFPIGLPPSGPLDARQFSQSSSSNTSSAASTGPRSYDSGDLALIATDLNNLVSGMIFEVNNELKNENDVKFKELDQAPLDFVPSGPEMPRSKSYNHIPRNVGIGIFNVSPKERVYLQEFYSGFASIILPFSAFDPVQMSYYNPMRDILFYCAYNESFMLAAILAQGARSVFMQSGSVDDEFAYYKYLSKCLELLGPALGDHMAKVESAPLPNIEAVLLTVLLLTSSNAANSKQNWRPHLRGAKDILLKHTTSRKDLSKSKLLLLCKYWFISFEILAGLGSKFGGSIESEEELDLLFEYSGRDEVHVLSNLGLVAHSGFYLIGGYHIDLIPAWKDLIKLLNRKRKNLDYKADESFEYLRLLAIFERQYNVEYVNKKALLKNSDFHGGFIPAGILLDLISVNHGHVVISWMDTSQQMYCLAATVTILTEFLGVSFDSPQVQALVRRLTFYLSFLTTCAESPPLIKCAVMMIQWPMMVAGHNSFRAEEKSLILEFFALAKKAGSGSAEYTASRMKRIWKNRETGSTEPVDDGVDVVTY